MSVENADAEEVVAVRVVVTGRVTGVGFRYCTRGQARHYPGLRGYVRNLGPGRVECVIQGRRRDVRAMLRWLATGPETAQVSEVTTEEIPITPERDLFHVRL